MKRRLPLLTIERDAWVQRMMRWHFSEETGSPYWLRRKKALSFDPLRDVTTFYDLPRFESYDVAELRRIDPGQLVPRGFAGRAAQVFETGGSSGPPCRIVDITRGDYDAIIYRCMLEAHGLAGGGAVAMVPSGPHAYGAFVRKLIASWGGRSMYIDFDPRWVKQEIHNGRSGREYIAHLLGQTSDLLALRAANLLFTTSRLLTELAMHCPRPLAEYGVRAVCTGGTSCTDEEIRLLRENFLADVAWFDTYGNTLMGHALQAAPWEGCKTRSYYLPPPFAYIRVVDPSNPSREVAIGERGRVQIFTLLEDLFVPGLLERDSATRVGPHPWFPWDGVAGLRPHDGADTEGIVEAVY